MIAVIFETWPKDKKYQEYLNIAANLKPELMGMDGFLSVERFQSLNDDKKILSLSFWQDETSVKKWRNSLSHRNAQAKGRNSIFDDYHIRIASVTRDYSMQDRHQTPTDSKYFHEVT